MKRAKVPTAKTRRRTHEAYPDSCDVVVALAMVGERLHGDADLADLLVAGSLHHDHLEHAPGEQVRVEARLPVGLQRRLLLHVPHFLACTVHRPAFDIFHTLTSIFHQQVLKVI